MPYNNRTNKGTPMITNEKILKLAKTCGFDDFSPEDRVCWECWEEQLIEFAQQIRKETINEILSDLKNVPNPEANRTAINRIETELN
jgi:hypothetical protein